MLTLSQAQPGVNPVAVIKVYFNNGVSARRPWHVAGGIAECRGLDSAEGSFAEPAQAISHGFTLANARRARLIVPDWLQAVADRIYDDARYMDIRENDRIGREECAGGF